MPTPASQAELNSRLHRLMITPQTHATRPADLNPEQFEEIALALAHMLAALSGRQGTAPDVLIRPGLRPRPRPNAPQSEDNPEIVDGPGFDNAAPDGLPPELLARRVQQLPPIWNPIQSAAQKRECLFSFEDDVEVIIEGAASAVHGVNGKYARTGPYTFSRMSPENGKEVLLYRRDASLQWRISIGGKVAYVCGSKHSPVPGADATAAEHEAAARDAVVKGKEKKKKRSKPAREHSDGEPPAEATGEAPAEPTAEATGEPRNAPVERDDSNGDVATPARETSAVETLEISARAAVPPPVRPPSDNADPELPSALPSPGVSPQPRIALPRAERSTDRSPPMGPFVSSAPPARARDVSPSPQAPRMLRQSAPLRPVGGPPGIKNWHPLAASPVASRAKKESWFDGNTAAPAELVNGIPEFLSQPPRLWHTSNGDMLHLSEELSLISSSDSDLDEFMCERDEEHDAARGLAMGAPQRLSPTLWEPARERERLSGRPNSRPASSSLPDPLCASGRASERASRPSEAVRPSSVSFEEIAFAEDGAEDGPADGPGTPPMNPLAAIPEGIPDTEAEDAEVALKEEAGAYPTRPDSLGRWWPPIKGWRLRKGSQDTELQVFVPPSHILLRRDALARAHGEAEAPRKKLPPFDERMNVELTLHIASFLDVKALSNFSCSSKANYKLLYPQEQHWARAARHTFPPGGVAPGPAARRSTIGMRGASLLTRLARRVMCGADAARASGAPGRPGRGFYASYRALALDANRENVWRNIHYVEDQPFRLRSRKLFSGMLLSLALDKQHGLAHCYCVMNIHALEGVLTAEQLEKWRPRLAAALRAPTEEGAKAALRGFNLKSLLRGTLSKEHLYAEGGCRLVHSHYKGAQLSSVGPARIVFGAPEKEKAVKAPSMFLSNIVRVPHFFFLLSFPLYDSFWEPGCDYHLVLDAPGSRKMPQHSLFTRVRLLELPLAQARGYARRTSRPGDTLVAHAARRITTAFVPPLSWLPTSKPVSRVSRANARVLAKLRAECGGESASFYMDEEADRDSDA